MAYGFEIYNNNGFLLASDTTIKYYTRQRGSISSISPWGGSRLTLNQNDLLFVNKSKQNPHYLTLDNWSFAMVTHDHLAYGMNPGEVGVAVYKSLQNYLGMHAGWPVGGTWMPESGSIIDYFIAAPINDLYISSETSGYGLEMYNEDGNIIFTANPNYQPVSIVSEIRTSASQWHHHGLAAKNIGDYVMPKFQNLHDRSFYVCINNATPVCTFSQQMNPTGSKWNKFSRCAFISEPAGGRGNINIMEATLYSEPNIFDRYTQLAQENNPNRVITPRYFDNIKRSPKNFLVALM